jgi:hypothetical protein
VRVVAEGLLAFQHDHCCGTAGGRFIENLGHALCRHK